MNWKNLTFREVLSALSAIAIAVALYLVFLFAPREAVMGDVQRVFYFHVSAAWVGYLALLVAFVTSILYLLLPHGNFVLPLVLGAIGLGSLIGCIVLIDSLLTDVIDHDCIKTGVRRSGVFFGVWRFASKLARAAATGGTGVILDMIGFVPNHAQSEDVRSALSLLFGPGVGVCFLTAALLLTRYKFTSNKQRQVQRILARRS